MDPLGDTKTFSKLFKGTTKSYHIMGDDDVVISDDDFVVDNDMDEVPLDDVNDPYYVFTTNISNIRDNLKRIEFLNSQIRSMYVQVLQEGTNNSKSKSNSNSNSNSNIRTIESGSQSNDFELLLQENNKLIVTTKELLSTVLNTKSVTEAEKKMKDTVLKQQSKKFMDLLSNYQQIQIQYKDKAAYRVKRHIMIVHPDMPPNEVDKLVRTDVSTSLSVFQENILGTNKLDAENRLLYIQDRHRDIVKLERSIRELHELFVDMAVIVADQGETIGEISHNVDQAKAYVTDAKKNLGKANVLQKRSRRRMCVIIFIIILLALVIIFVPSLVLTLKKGATI